MSGRDIPIIFSGPMVRALLSGRKTMTRRLVKSEIPPAPAMDAINPANKAKHPAPYFDAYCSERKTPSNPRGMSRNWCWWTRDDRQCLPTINVRFQPGDRLWVRESLKHVTSDPVTAEPCSLHCYMANVPNGMDSANPYEDNYLFPGEFSALKPKSIPSIHMPRWASRLTLVVTSVKVERIGDISEQDAIAEGVSAYRAGWSVKEAAEAFLRGTEAAVETKEGSTAQRLFYLLWASLHGKESWQQNPFVVAVSFRVIKANIDAPEARAAA